MEKLQKVVVFGASGLLGPYVCDALLHNGFSVVPVGKDNAETSCDLTSPAATKAFIAKQAPDIVINLVAMTNVDACEEHPGTADIMNHQTVANIVSALPAETKFVHVSTDQVYSDGFPTPHKEDTVAPVNVYGRTKLLGEEAALKHEGALVLRTNIFGESRTRGRTSLSDFFIKSFTEQTPIKLFTDSIFSPLHMTTVGEMLVKCLRQNVSGVYNLAARTGLSKADFALHIAKNLGTPTINAECLESSAVDGRAPRPKRLNLDVTKLEQTLGTTMPTLEEEILKACAPQKLKSKTSQLG